MLTEWVDTLVHNRYSILEQLYKSAYFGDLVSAVEKDTDRSVWLFRLPAHIVSFIGHEQIKLRAHLFQDPALPMVRVEEVYPSQEGTYVAYEPIPGAKPLLEYIEGKPLAVILEVLKRLSDAIAILHERTLWHGGIVPQYVFVTTSGEVRLLTMLSDSPYAFFNAVGTDPQIQYFAPETLTMNPLDARTDIYNLGVLFYYALTHKFPFNELDSAIWAPSRLNEHVPPPLDRLVLKMINAKPTKRFQWIGQVIDELTRLLGSYNAMNPTQGRTYGSERLFSAEFTGREEEVARLWAFNEQVLNGKNPTILVTGQKGAGRKRLIYEASARYLNDISILGCSKFPNAPFAAVEEIALKLFRVCFGVPKMESVGRHWVNILGVLMPRVAADNKDMMQEELRQDLEQKDLPALLLEFFAECLIAFGQPMIFEIYGAHMLDEDSVWFFKKLLSNENIKLGLLGMCEDASPTALMLFADQLDVEPMPLEQMRDCVMSRFGDASFLDDDFINWLAHHARGSMAVVFNLLEYLADTRQIYLERYVWHMVPESVDKLNIPESMESMIFHRVKKMSSQALEFCQALSLFQGAFVLEAITKAVDMPSIEESLAVLQSLIDRGVLLHHINHYRFASNNIKQYIYESIPLQKRRHLHRRLANCMREIRSKEYAEMAYHFAEAGEWKLAIHQSAVGAKSYYRQNQLTDAELMIRQAIDLYRHLPNRTCPNSFYLFHARVLKQQGALEAAANVYRDLYARTGLMRVMASLTLVYVNMGHYDLITPYVPMAEEHLKNPRLASKARLQLMVMLGMYNIDKGNYQFILDLEKYQQEHGGELRKQLSVREYIGWLYNLHVMLHYVPDVSWEDRASYLHEAASLAEHYNYPQTLIGIYNCFAIGLQETDPRKAKDYYLQSASLAAELGDKSKESSAYINLVESYRMLGDMYHSYRYIEKAREIGATIFKHTDTYLLKHEIEHFLFIEDYDKAMRVIRELTRTAKLMKYSKMRDYAFLYRFRWHVEQGHRRQTDRMWPVVERICKNRRYDIEHQFLRGYYYLQKKRYEDVVEEFSELMKETNVATEIRIKRHLLYLEALLQVGRWHEGLELANELQNLIHTTGYVGYLARSHFYLGRLYQLTHQFVHANLNYKRALMWFRKLNQQSRLLEMDRLMNQTNMDMMRVADVFLDRMKKDIQVTDQKSVDKIATAGVQLKGWARTIINERQEMIETLTDNEILLDAIRRVSSSIMIKTVCESLGSVVFENLLFDHIHFKVRITADRSETIHLDEQMQGVRQINPSVHTLFDSVAETERAIEVEERGTYLLAIPIFSHDQQVMAVMVLEKLSLQSPFTARDKRFLTNISQLVSSNVENAIMYEVMITDNLTGLYLRNYFEKRLNEEFTKVQRYSIDLSYLMIDLDNFSKINNQFGHAEGDRALRIVAKTLLKSVRNVDIVGRYGGEELIVILPNTPGNSARVVAERILNNLRNINIEGNRYQITASIGVSSSDMDRPIDWGDLAEKADQAETHAKRTGKNRVICYWEMNDSERQMAVENPVTRT